MTTFWVEIHGHDVAERHRLEAGLRRLGRGATATAATRAFPEFPAPIELLCDDDGCAVRLPHGSPAPLVLRGTEHLEASVPWGEEVFVAGYRLSFIRRIDGERQKNPLLVFAAILVLFAGAFSFAKNERSVPGPAREIAAPALPDREVFCPSLAAPSAARASALEAAAFARRERFPFSAADGAEAVTLFRRACACFRDARLLADAARASDEATVMAGRVSGRYAAIRLTLHASLEQKNYAGAIDAVRDLEALLGPGSDPYRNWLAELRRNLGFRGY